MRCATISAMTWRAFALPLAIVALLAFVPACREKAGAPSGPSPQPSGDSSTDRARASVRAIEVSPELVTSGRIRTARARSKVPSGAVRLPAEIVASPEGAAEAGTLVAGRVARFEAREGDRVKRGQVLAWLDAPDAARAMSDVVRARARTETLERKVARLEGLVASEAATRIALDEARLELELARADLAAARTLATSLGLGEPPAPREPGGPARALPAQLPIRSPVDGVVVERATSIGAHVAPEARLFRLLSEGRVLVEARLVDGAPFVPAAGAVAHLEPRGAARCAARVLGVLPEVDLATRSRRVRILPDEACRGLVPGAQADVEVETALEGDGGAANLGEVIVVPAVAIVEVKSAPFVFVRGRLPGAFEVRPVEPGLRVGEERVISVGVTQDEEVVVDGAILLKGELMRAELGGED